MALGNLLGAAMPRGAPSDLATWKLVAWWQRAAGRPLSDHVWPARLERGLLTLSADSSTWANEVSFVRETLLAKLAADLPQLNVKRLRTVVGLARPELAGPAPAPAPPAAPPAPHVPLPRDLSVALSQIGDERLRSAIARAARTALAAYEPPPQPAVEPAQEQAQPQPQQQPQPPARPGARKKR